ncbi:MAG: hypothetical protein ABR576_03590 [Thermoanaerobaculia bacterium]
MRRALLIASFAGLFPAAGLIAQQLPVQGCRAAISCAGPRGYYSLTNATEGNTLFQVGVGLYDGRLQGRLVRPVRSDVDWRAVDAAVEIFVRRNTLRRPDPATSRNDSARRPQGSPQNER